MKLLRFDPFKINKVDPSHAFKLNMIPGLIELFCKEILKNNKSQITWFLTGLKIETKMKHMSTTLPVQVNTGDDWKRILMNCDLFFYKFYKDGTINKKHFKWLMFVSDWIVICLSASSFELSKQMCFLSISESLRTETLALFSNLNEYITFSSFHRCTTTMAYHLKEGNLSNYDTFPCEKMNGYLAQYCKKTNNVYENHQTIMKQYIMYLKFLDLLTNPKYEIHKYFSYQNLYLFQYLDVSIWVNLLKKNFKNLKNSKSIGKKIINGLFQMMVFIVSNQNI